MIKLKQSCSFCRKSYKKVRFIFAKKNVAICDDCVLACVNQIFEKAVEKIK